MDNWWAKMQRKKKISKIVTVIFDVTVMVLMIILLAYLTNRR